MRTAIVFSAIIIAYAISSEATDRLLGQAGFALGLVVFLFFVMDILDFGKGRN